MAKLLKIWIDSQSYGEGFRHSVRLDWDNDRHQLVYLDSLDSKDIEAGLVRVCVELRKERRNREI